MVEKLKPLTEGELEGAIRHIEDLRANLLQEANMALGGQTLEDTKRLVMEVRRLRRLVAGASRLLTPGVASKISAQEAREIYEAIKAEVDRG